MKTSKIGTSDMWGGTVEKLPQGQSVVTDVRSRDKLLEHQQ